LQSGFAQNTLRAFFAADKYLKEKVDRVVAYVPKGQKAGIKAHAEGMGETLNKFVLRAINETIKRDGAST